LDTRITIHQLKSAPKVKKVEDIPTAGRAAGGRDVVEVKPGDQVIELTSIQSGWESHSNGPDDTGKPRKSAAKKPSPAAGEPAQGKKTITRQAASIVKKPGAGKRTTGKVPSKKATPKTRNKPVEKKVKSSAKPVEKKAKKPVSAKKTAGSKSTETQNATKKDGTKSDTSGKKPDQLELKMDE
jgi:hypothetical protein